MHSSCIVVRLDWAAGLPAWIIRSFASPALTKKTLFSSQKHQSHSSWDRSEDRWLALKINTHRILDLARRSPETLVTDRIYHQYHIVIFSGNTVCQVYDNTPNVIILLVSSAQAGWENQFQHQPRPTLRTGGSWHGWMLMASFAQITHTHSSPSVTQDRFYTSAMHIQCFSSK